MKRTDVLDQGRQVALLYSSVLSGRGTMLDLDKLLSRFGQHAKINEMT